MLANDLKLVTKDIAAEVFSVSVKTIDNYIRDGLLPQPKRFVSKEYWHPDDFRAFLAQTFRSEPAASHQVTGVTQEPVTELASSEPSASRRAQQRKTAVRVKDTSPVARERARQKDLLVRLNAHDRPVPRAAKQADSSGEVGHPALVAGGAAPPEHR